MTYLSEEYLKKSFEVVFVWDNLSQTQIVQFPGQYKNLLNRKCSAKTINGVKDHSVLKSSKICCLNFELKFRIS